MKNGYVAITGKPNVGKSTFLNTLLKNKVSIVSFKPQTTRNQISAIYEDKDVKIQFIDTPGYHEPHNKLDLFLNSEIKNSYKTADVVLFFVDLTRPIDEEDEAIIKLLINFKIEKVVLVLTKYDVSNQNKVKQYVDNIESKIKCIDCLYISSKQNLNLDNLIDIIKNNLPDIDMSLEVQLNDNFKISELIREQIILNTRQELPYSTGVFIESNNYDSMNKTLNVSGVIVVEKDSQKPIIIGKNGSMIKKIGTNVRKELLLSFKNVNLKLFVKVQSDWRNDEHFLKQIGYSNK